MLPAKNFQDSKGLNAIEKAREKKVSARLNAYFIRAITIKYRASHFSIYYY